jgi:hypothetical protein
MKSSGLWYDTRQKRVAENCSWKFKALKGGFHPFGAFAIQSKARFTTWALFSSSSSESSRWIIKKMVGCKTRDYKKKNEAHRSTPVMPKTSMNGVKQFKFSTTEVSTETSTGVESAPLNQKDELLTPTKIRCSMCLLCFKFPVSFFK